jgi:hypothetical protein
MWISETTTRPIDHPARRTGVSREARAETPGRAGA